MPASPGEGRAGQGGQGVEGSAAGPQGRPPCAQGQAMATSAIPQSVCSGLLRVDKPQRALIPTVIYIY